ncbi:nitroreductase family protein [Salisediminibacterium beveridgei]|uniref:Oxygen-insensitive NAD(P)H nitroreductase n=1 Tax=Salisediminibacterium beveridgei TaxID=632773 RepID=A0A1D7QY98_9BACI|nr:nitroreductase family protein [Salisediminibacterium beveridgei]AOM83986.1 Oxygen-insensitive NAD(P)H nitroreductase [Salisediminibacterium beveridgei]
MTNNHTIADAGLFQTMEERHSVKAYDPSVKIPEEELKQMLEMSVTAPSSWNLQHWKFLVIDDEAQQEKLLPIAYGQKQVKDSAAVIGILGDIEANRNVEGIFTDAVKQGHLTEEIKEKIVGSINSLYEGDTSFPRDEAILNASLAAMQLMLSARGMGYDTCPMGGFDRDAFIEAFHIPERYVPVMLVTVGKRETDPRVSSRLPLDEVVVRNSF